MGNGVLNGFWLRIYWRTQNGRRENQGATAEFKSEVLLASPVVITVELMRNFILLKILKGTISRASLKEYSNKRIKGVTLRTEKYLSCSAGSGLHEDVGIRSLDLLGLKCLTLRNGDSQEGSMGV